MDWSDSIKTVREEFIEKFIEKYPNIKIKYTQLPSENDGNLGAVKG